MTDIPRIALLGYPTLTVAGETVAISAHHAALLSIFSLRGVTTLSRAEAAGLLWPHSGTASARHSLSQCIYSLRKLTRGRCHIRGGRSDIELRDVTVDVREFDEAVQRCDWLTAETLYRGDLLQGIEIPVADEFLEWIADLRQHYARLAMTVGEELALEGRSDLSSELLRRSPARATAQSAPPATPLGTAPNYAQHPPRGASDTADRVMGVPAAACFVGRRKELEKLEECHARSTLSGITCVALEGEPGIGKTALALRFARRRALRGSRVLFARGYPAESHVPFGAVAQWLRDLPDTAHSLGLPWTHIIAQAFPGTMRDRREPRLMDDDGTFSEYQILEALTRLFTHVSSFDPLLVVLDDAHVADAASLGFIHYLARRSPDAPILFLGTVRKPAVHGRNPFTEWPGLARLMVHPLSRSEIASLAAKLRGPYPDLSPERLRNVTRRTGGNPLLLASLLAAGDDTAVAVPDSILEFFGPRFNALSLDALLLLAAISVAGETVEVSVAAAISGLAAAPERTTAALRELDAGALIIREAADLIRPQHGIVAEVAMARLPEAERRALYGRAARVLSEGGRSPAAVVAVQHDIAGDRGRAFDAAMTAASASEKLHAAREQEFFLKLALSNAPDSDAAAEVRIALAELFRANGRPAEGLDIVAETAMLEASPALQSRARAARLSIRLYRVSDLKGTTEALHEIERLAEHLDDQIVAELYWSLIAAAHDLGHVAIILIAVQRAAALSEELPATVRSVRLAANCALTVGLYHCVDDGLAALERLLPTVPSGAPALSHCRTAQGTLLIAAGRLIEAENIFLEGIELGERWWLHAVLFGLHNNLGVCYVEQGRYREAGRELRKASECTGPSESAMATDNLAILHLERGEYEQAIRTVRAIPVPAGIRSSRGLFFRHALTGLCSLELGLLAQAFEAKREIDLLFQHHEYWSNDISYVETFMARMLVMEGKAAVARERLQTAIEVYRGRDMMCRSRLELELARIDLKLDPTSSRRRSEAMLEELRGSGARPLIDRFDELADRARRRSS